jgi:hypothetical protein
MAQLWRTWTVWSALGIRGMVLRVQVDLLPEHFNVFNVLWRDVVELVKSTILRSASFVSKVMAPVGVWQRRGHVAC